ncbi:unnamed protein product [Urochloa humidicola]
MESSIAGNKATSSTNELLLHPSSSPTLHPLSSAPTSLFCTETPFLFCPSSSTSLIDTSSSCIFTGDSFFRGRNKAARCLPPPTSVKEINNMGGGKSKVVIQESAKSVEVFHMLNDLQEQLEATKKELKNQVVAAMKKELHEHFKATKEELKRQSEATKKEHNSHQLVLATKKELQEHLKGIEEELKKQSEKTMEDMKDLEHKNTKLSSEKGELGKQLEYARKAVLVLIDAADAYQEATEKQIKEKVEELEDTRKAALVFMDTADAYQEATEIKIKAQAEDLEDRRKVALVFMDAADTYQEAEEKQIKEMVEELKDTRIVFMDATDMYQEVAEKQIKAMVQTLEMKEADANAFDADMEDIMKEPEDLKSNAEKIKTVKGLVVPENEMLWSEDFMAEQEYDLYEVEVESTEMQLSMLMEAEEAAAKAFDDRKATIMKELEEIHAQADKLGTESKVLHVPMLQLQASCDELDAKCSHIN